MSLNQKFVVSHRVVSPAKEIHGAVVVEIIEETKA